MPGTDRSWTPQATFDSIALCKEGAKLDDFKAIARLLLQQKGVENIETELTSSIPDCAEAEERQRERILAVRARCLAAEQTRKDAERRRGLEAIAEHYAPLHPETMDVTAIHSASSGGTAIVSEPLPGVFSFPLLSADMCRKVWEELHHYESTACNNPAWDLPLRVRHDGYLLPNHTIKQTQETAAMSVRFVPTMRSLCLWSRRFVLCAIQTFVPCVRRRAETSGTFKTAVSSRFSTSCLRAVARFCSSTCRI